MHLPGNLYEGFPSVSCRDIVSDMRRTGNYRHEPDMSENGTETSLLGLGRL